MAGKKFKYNTFNMEQYQNGEMILYHYFLIQSVFFVSQFDLQMILIVWGCKLTTFLSQH